MVDHDDPELAKRFAALRAREESQAPPFDAVLDAARRRAPRPVPIRPWRALGAAAAVMIAIAGSWLALRPHVGAPTSVPVWDWKSPTASLLDVPGTHLLIGMPALPGAATNPLELPNLNGGIR
jgi:hypothetical protein